MRIALFASAFYPHVGGVEELCRQLAHAYNAAGHPTIILTHRWPPDLPVTETYEGIPVFRVPMRTADGSIRQRLAYYCLSGAAHRRVADILKAHQTDVAHIQCASCNTGYALVAARTLGIPLLLTTQGERTMDAGRLYQTSQAANQVLREAVGAAAAVTACSKDTLDELARWYGAPISRKASVIYNGISLSEFAAATHYAYPRPFILGIGRLVPQKGFDLLLDAFAQSGVWSHDLLLAGEGPERDALQGRASRLGLKDRVKFVGRAAREQAVQLFTGCDLFVLPSRIEPQGIVNLEAMAAGKPVLASRTGGVPEIVRDNENGILFEAGNVKQLAERLAQLCGDSELRDRLGAQGRQDAQKYDWGLVAARYLELFGRLTDRAPTP